MLGRRLAKELLARIVVEVGAARAVIEQPRLVRLGLLLDERLGILAPLLVEFGKDGDGHLLDVGQFLALGRVHEAAVEGHVLDPLGARVRIDDLGEEVRVAPLRVHVGDGEEAVEIVVADMLRLALHVLAEMPLADRLRRVTGLAEQHRQGDLALQAAGFAVHRRTMQPVTVRYAAGVQRRARRRAGGFGIAGGKLQAAARDLVEVRRRRADGDAAAVAAEIAPADIVHEIDEDVGLLLACGEFSRCGFDVFPVHESGFEMVCLAHGLRCDGVESRHVSSVDLRANYSLAASVAMARASAVSGAP